MRPAAPDTLITHIRQLAGRSEVSVQSDAELLERFSAGRDAAAFAGLMQRHAAMVWQVCRNVLRHDQDAEDAFQATFSVLAHKAGSIARAGALASWLHGVAYRVATRAGRDAAVRRARERAGAKAAATRPPVDADLREALAVVDEEVRKLSHGYRTAFVLCHLEGRSVAEAARLVGIGPGALAVRLSRARAQLRERLARRGVALSAALSVAALARTGANASPPAALVSAVENTARFASVPTPRTGAFAHEVTKAMSTVTARPRFVLLLALCVLGAGSVVLTRPGQSADPPRAAADEKSTTPPPRAETAKQAEDPKPAARQAPARDPVATELREMRGTWTTTTTERRFINGEPQPPRQITVTYVIDGDKMFMLGQDGFIDELMFLQADPRKKPKTVDLVSRTVGTLKGVYRLDGDKLRIHIEPEVGKQQRRPEQPADDDKSWWLVLRRSSRTPAKAVSRFANAPGWFWTIEPTTNGGTLATLGIVLRSDRGRDGVTRITLASAFSGNNPPKHRAVVLDAAKNRYSPTPDGAGSSGRLDGTGVAVTWWRMDPKVLPADKVALIGVETLDHESRPIAAQAALDRVGKAAIEVLRCPEVGKPFDFTLTTIDGKKLRSADLRGKVILIDCWTTACAPCIDRLAELKALYERSHKDGLEVIGVSFDPNVARLKKSVEKYELPWPQVLVPPDDATRKLWQEVTGIDAVPQIFLIDRRGILHDESPNLKDEIDRLLKETPATQ
jgi:RNA polymerase sigma factor (sigma-70 family)